MDSYIDDIIGYVYDTLPAYAMHGAGKYGNFRKFFSER